MIAALLLAGALAHAQTAQSAYDAGVQAAHQGDHHAAAAQFAEALKLGGVDPAVYHGLGNALYREGQAGLAITAWRRAQALSPRDGDIAANLDRARHQAKDRLDSTDLPHGPFFWQSFLSRRESALLASLLLTLSGLSLVIRRLRAGARWGWDTAFTAVLGLLLVASTVSAGRQRQGAVIIQPQVTAKSALGPAGIDLFLLHEGAEVRVAERDEDHVLIVLPDERKGWVPDTAIASTDPSAAFPLHDPAAPRTGG